MLIAMWRDTTDLTGAELAAMGFRKIAGDDLIYRHSALLTEYNKQHPRGIDWLEIEFTATPEHEKWVRREFSRLLRDEENDPALAIVGGALLDVLLGNLLIEFLADYAEDLQSEVKPRSGPLSRGLRQARHIAFQDGQSARSSKSV